MNNSLRLFRRMALVGVMSFAASCASARNHDRQIDHALHLCKEFLGPDAGKAEGEAWLWFQSERVKASRRLGSPSGVRAIDARIAAATNEVDLSCLNQMRQKADTRQVMPEWPGR
ncbi:hypothetical protein [Montanilutibacter psychrotolerans]|uniref:hypothetical protein n=1 Tax=Montanilutibacter psychrotolerans TaxID=1327343 RepID=UPI0011CE4996|nr:hypothetical protein [Lysobacter psychrotolerans]